jgi:hypothetical protein
MEFMRRTAGYSLLDHRGNKDILDLKAEPVEKKFAQYKQNRLNNVSRMENIDIKNKLLGYRPIRRRRLLEEHNREAETGHLLT